MRFNQFLKDYSNRDQCIPYTNADRPFLTSGGIIVSKYIFLILIETRQWWNILNVGYHHNERMIP